MCAVGPRTTTRRTRPALSISWATFRPNVVLPAAGVAEARKLAPSCSASAERAARCQARRGLVAGQAGRTGAASVVIRGGPRYAAARTEYLGGDRAPEPGHPRPRRGARTRGRVG